ncbi:ATP-grasp domain-containing protein [Ruania zhangjianzhongii]|uniref:carboxylate--amine ligase n=1 Tax=Ruania zhangjianzhongii TaxID=2603206 RepID=UPI0011C83370|nr:ATP-grasp domain-containing protein [Ruania zhangjianzhongii]
MSPTSPRPVLLGTDLGIYAMARSFHEAFGVTSVVISELPRGPVNDSAIVRNVFTGSGSSDEQILTALQRVAEQEPEATPVLVVNSDHQLAFVLRHRERIERHYVVPYAAERTIATLANKTAMYQVTERLGIPTPATVEVDPSADPETWRTAAAELTFPIVMKPFAGAEFEELEFAGHRKVYRLDDPAELVTELERIAAAGYTGTMLLQQLILGDDAYNRVVNLYRDGRGQITMAASGRVLLAMHQPTFIGNSAIIMVDYDEELIAQATAVLDAVDYRGFASIDYKVDSRDGLAYLLDINPRPGRSHYYAGVGGASAARSVVADFVTDEPLPTQRATTPGIYAYIPTFVLRRYVRDRELLRRARAVLRRRRAVHPLAYAADRNLKRWWYRILAQVNQLRGLWRFYRRPTDSGF